MSPSPSLAVMPPSHCVAIDEGVGDGTDEGVLGGGNERQCGLPVDTY